MNAKTERVVSEVEAWAIARKFASDCEAALGEDLIAVVVVGSLGAGRYVPGRSDIIVIVADECVQERVAEVTTLAQRYGREANLPNGFGGYAVRERDLIPPFGALTNR